MSKLEKAMDCATANGISVVESCLFGRKSASLKERRVIGIDNNEFNCDIDKAIAINHEIGHHMTQAFYSLDAPLVTRGKCESRASEWAIKNMLPLKDIKCAVSDGCRSVGELSERFELPHRFINEAIKYYTRKGKL